MRLLRMDDYMELGMNLKNCDVRPVDRTRDRLYPPTFSTWSAGFTPPFAVKVEFPTESVVYYGIA